MSGTRCNKTALPDAIDKIAHLNIDEDDKKLLTRILRSEFGVQSQSRSRKIGGKRPKKTARRRRQTGGLDCDNLSCVAVLATLIFIGYGIGTCVYPVGYVNIVKYIFDSYMGTFNILFGISFINGYNKANGSTPERQDAAQKGFWEIPGKIHFAQIMVGKIVGYINRIKDGIKKGHNCQHFLPVSLFDILKLLCELKNNNIDESKAKIEIDKIMKEQIKIGNIVNIDESGIVIKDLPANKMVRLNIEIVDKIDDGNQVIESEIMHTEDEAVPIPPSRVVTSPENLDMLPIPPPIGLRHRNRRPPGYN